jgi:hypothetical protein
MAIPMKRDDASNPTTPGTIQIITTDAIAITVIGASLASLEPLLLND